MAIRKIAYEFNPFQKTGIKIKRNRQKAARQAVARFVRSQVLDHMENSESPVSGGRWKKSLSEKYSKKVGKEVADLWESGALRSALNVVEKKGNTLSLQVSGSQAGKADGNNRGTYGKSSRSNLKNAREFIPRGNKTLNQEIREGIKEVLRRFKD